MKLQACAELIRLDLAFGAGFFAIAGEVFAIGGMPPLQLALLGFFSLFFISGTANITNDYFDRDVDRVNLPGRPLPSGRITVLGLFALFLLCSAAGFAAAALLGPLVLALVAVLFVIAQLYNLKLKESGITGNFVVAACVGMTVLVGGIAAGTVNGLVLTFALLAALFDLGEEIASDAMDVKGDELRSSRSIAKRWGRERAVGLATAVFCLFLAFTLLPFGTGWFRYEYLAPVLLLDAWMLWCIRNLVRSRTSEDGRVEVRRLYLSWGLFVVVITVFRVLLPAVT